MATLTSGQLTLADWAKRQDPDGVVPKIAEILSQQNEILEDAVFIQGNLPTRAPSRPQPRWMIRAACWKHTQLSIATWLS
jgi:hypothetical protein